MLFGITAMKDLTIFVKINTFGVIFTVIIIVFIVGVGIFSMTDPAVSYELVTSNPNIHKDGDEWVVELALFGSGYKYLMGILGGGFYLHNISLPIYQNSRN